jgi:uncharacterized protein (TIGR03000 family)
MPNKTFANDHSQAFKVELNLTRVVRKWARIFARHSGEQPSQRFPPDKCLQGPLATRTTGGTSSFPASFTGNRGQLRPNLNGTVVAKRRASEKDTRAMSETRTNYSQTFVAIGASKIPAEDWNFLTERRLNMRRLHFTLSVFALGLLLLASEKAAAQAFGPGHQGPHWSGGGSYSGRSYGGRLYTPAPAYAPVYSPAPTTSESFFSAPVRDNRTVLIDVRVPADAKIWFDNDATKQTGAERQFVSPPLTHGKYFEYQIRAQWNENGKKKEQTRRVTFQAGDRIHLDFSSVE